VSFRTQRLLKQAKRYGPVAGHDAVELYLGLATFNEPGTSPTIRSIAVQRMVFVDGQPLATPEFERTLGEEERVDSGAPYGDPCHSPFMFTAALTEESTKRLGRCRTAGRGRATPARLYTHSRDSACGIPLAPPRSGHLRGEPWSSKYLAS
jgi:hypothetical protein